jgi:hypothetical protein
VLAAFTVALLAATPSLAQLPLSDQPPRTAHNVQACAAQAKKRFTEKYGKSATFDEFRIKPTDSPYSYESHYSAKFGMCLILTEEASGNGDKYYMLSDTKTDDIYGVFSVQSPSLITCWVGFSTAPKSCNSEVQFMMLVKEQTDSI